MASVAARKASAINRAHPATRGLQLLAVSQGAGMVDLQRRQKGTNTGTVTAARDMIMGDATNVAVNTTKIGFSGRPTANYNTVTWGGLIRFAGTTGQIQYICADSASKGTAGSSLRIQATNVNMRLGSTSITATFTVAAGAIYFVCGSTTPAASGNLSNVVARRLDTNEIFTGSGNFSTAMTPGGNIEVGDASTNFLNGDASFVLQSYTYMPLAALIAWARDPWGVFDQSDDLDFWGSLPAAGGGVTVALTGNASTAAQGTLGVKNTHALTGNASTASEGSVKAAQPLHGNQAAASEGTLGVKLTVALTGNASTASQGTIKATPTKALTGNQVSAAQGSLGKTLSRALTGNPLTAAEGTLTPSTSGNVSVALTGISMTARQGTLTAVAPYALSVGGHFIPLTEKQLREQKKWERRDRQLRDDLDESRRLDALGIEADIRSILTPAPDTPIIPQENIVELAEDEDDDLEFLLLHA